MAKKNNQIKIKKIVFVGLGSIGQRHLNIFIKKYKYCEKILIQNRNKIKFSINDKKITVVKNCEEAIKLNPDAVIISTPTTTHLDYAIKFAKANINLFIEKPISNNYKTKKLNKFFNLVKKNNKIICYIGYVLRFEPGLIKLHNLLKKKEIIGKILYVRSTYGSYLPSWRKINYLKSVSSSKKKGGGILLELSHEIDYLNYLFGKFTSIYSYLFNSKTLKINVDESADIILINKNKFPIYLHLDFNRRFKSRICEIQCENGEIVYDITKCQINYHIKGVKKKYKFNNIINVNYIYLEQIKFFLNLVKRKITTDIYLKNSIEVLKITQGIIDSNKVGKKINI